MEPAPPPDAQQQARLAKQRLCNAYKEVFGLDTTRTDAQRLVYDDLNLGIGEDDETYRFQDKRDGIAIIASGLRRDGAQSIMRLIRQRLKHAEVEPNPKTKKVVRR